ncbi:MAG: hypothetical protein ABI925_02100 [Verrucomicrobiota bacterium]
MELSLRSHLQLSPDVDRTARQVPVLIESSVGPGPDIWIIAAALIATFLKLAIAYTTIGTNDSVSFYVFARSLAEHGLAWTYVRGAEFLPIGPIFNHPPVTAYYLQLIERLTRTEFLQACGVTFPFLLRLPGIVADFIVVAVLTRLSRTDARCRLPLWALLFFAVSPVSLMVSGFHGNTDSVMVMFLFLAAVACIKNRALFCGLFLALSCQVKIIPLLFFPIFFLFWSHRREAGRFMAPFVLTNLALWWEPLSKFPVLFAKNVLLYGSFWGNWGITYWLRFTHLETFSRVSFMNLSVAQTAIAILLKISIITAILGLAWRRRSLDGYAMIKSMGYAWLIFFALSPGICPQYMVWLAPFILVFSCGLYAWLTVASSLFLFFFYNTIAHGLPWFLVVSKNSDIDACAPWALWPWVTIVIALVVLWRRAQADDSSLRLFSLNSLPGRFA